MGWFVTVTGMVLPQIKRQNKVYAVDIIVVLC